MALQVDTLAQAAVIEAKRLDEREARPQREADLRRKQGEDNRMKNEKARRLNKPSFALEGAIMDVIKTGTILIETATVVRELSMAISTGQ